MTALWIGLTLTGWFGLNALIVLLRMRAVRARERAAARRRQAAVIHARHRLHDRPVTPDPDGLHQLRTAINNTRKENPR